MVFLDLRLIFWQLLVHNDEKAEPCSPVAKVARSMRIGTQVGIGGGVEQKETLVARHDYNVAARPVIWPLCF